MSDIFQKIIGYPEIKKELTNLTDVLQHPEKYSKLGVRPPKGLLLYGIPGVGKTLMANCLIQASGRPAFVCRKTTGGEKFVEVIKETFRSAAEAAPAVILLDDMDKYANDDDFHINSEEFVAIQSCIDEYRDIDLFVIATANSIRHMPNSLIRKGRFDRRIEVPGPDPESAEKIIRHFLEGKQTVADIDAKTIAAILNGRSCATLETIINEAGILAALQNKNHIEMDDIVQACIRVLYDTPLSDNIISEETLTQIAVHEAGHAIMSEILIPGSIHLISVCQGCGEINGITATSHAKKHMRIQDLENQILIALAGSAAVELVYGEADPGAGEDLKNAYLIAKHLNDICCIYHSGNYEVSTFDSEYMKARQDEQIYMKVQEYYRICKQTLARKKIALKQFSSLLTKSKYIYGAQIQDMLSPRPASKQADQSAFQSA